MHLIFALPQEAVSKSNYSRLKDDQGRPPGVIGLWPARAVSFVDNHDTGSTQVSSRPPLLRQVGFQRYAADVTSCMRHMGVNVMSHSSRLICDEEKRSEKVLHDTSPDSVTETDCCLALECQRVLDRQTILASRSSMFSVEYSVLDTVCFQNHWPFPKDEVLQGYAYILTHPGVPTVFYDHFFEWGGEMKAALSRLVRHPASLLCASVTFGLREPWT